jgi:hypothetical protein
MNRVQTSGSVRRKHTHTACRLEEHVASAGVDHHVFRRVVSPTAAFPLTEEEVQSLQVTVRGAGVVLGSNPENTYRVVVFSKPSLRFVWSGAAQNCVQFWANNAPVVPTTGSVVEMGFKLPGACGSLRGNVSEAHPTIM